MLPFEFTALQEQAPHLLIVKRILFSIVCVVGLVACSFGSLPVIDDPAQLTKDCHALLASSNFDIIEADKWPNSIVKLNPVMVEKEGSALYITTFAQVDVGARGYVVADAKPLSDNHRSISDSGYPGIYRFDFKP